MSKRFTKLIAAFAATMTMLPASAQVMPENQVLLLLPEFCLDRRRLNRRLIR